MEYLTAIAQAEDLDLQARHRNPTGQGIHNKMVLAQIGGKGWAIVGSLNGGEVSAKLNREMALLVGSDEVYAYLADVFWYDWDVTPKARIHPCEQAKFTTERGRFQLLYANRIPTAALTVLTVLAIWPSARPARPGTRTSRGRLRRGVWPMSRGRSPHPASRRD